MEAAAAKTDGVTAEVHKSSFQRSRRSGYLLATNVKRWHIIDEWEFMNRSKLSALLNEKDACDDSGWEMSCAGALDILAMKGN